MTHTLTERITRCRMTDTKRNPCTGEALDPNGEVLICATHAAAVMRQIGERTRSTGLGSATRAHGSRA